MRGFDDRNTLRIAVPLLFGAVAVMTLNSAISIDQDNIKPGPSEPFFLRYSAHDWLILLSLCVVFALVVILSTWILGRHHD